MEAKEDLVVRHRSKTDEVTALIRRLILTRELVPGQRIRQVELAQMMGVSTMPVREALLRLVSEGMIVAESNKSFIISATTTPDGLRDIYWIHAELAGELAARAWDRRSPELLAEMNRQHRTYVDALPKRDSAVLFASNWSFHSAIHHEAMSPAILLVMRNTVRYFPDFSHDWPGWNELGVQWQAGLIYQFTNGNRDGAQAVVHEYCQKSAELYIAEYWPDEETPDQADEKALDQAPPPAPASVRRPVKVRLGEKAKTSAMQSRRAR